MVEELGDSLSILKLEVLDRYHYLIVCHVDEFNLSWLHEEESRHSKGVVMSTVFLKGAARRC